MSLHHTRVLRALNVMRRFGVRGVWEDGAQRSMHPLDFYQTLMFGKYPDPQFHRTTRVFKVSTHVR